MTIENKGGQGRPANFEIKDAYRPGQVGEKGVIPTPDEALIEQMARAKVAARKKLGKVPAPAGDDPTGTALAQRLVDKTKGVKALTPAEEAKAQRMGERIAHNIRVERMAREKVEEYHAQQSQDTYNAVDGLARSGIISRDGADSLKKQIIANADRRTR